MKVRVRLTGILSQYVGWTEAEMTLADGASLSDLLAILAEQAGEYGEMFFEKQTGFPALDILTVVNGAASPGTTVFHAGDVVTLMPPAVGGCPTATN
ncbi:MAG: MoaD/ThiS family protein [Chloroflexi bacterium]|nr:MoaD/ThiS family protein [Chloroflexota bacterium]